MPRSLLRSPHSVALVAFGSLAIALTAVAAPPAGRDLAVRAQALLSKRCLSCHGNAAMGGLDIRARAALLKGGKRGAAVVPGDPDASLLYRVVSGQADVTMPPSGTLSPEERRLLHDWIAAGAQWPVGSRHKAAGSGVSQSAIAGWALRDLVRPAVPTVKDGAWVRNPIDAFVLAKLEAKGLKPAPPADRRTLIRRLSFDLTGLPPDPVRVERFVGDRAPDAYEKLVDEYLASPAYGERWARHWLDVARFAESQGFERDKIRDHAWRYRDYVIDAFNSDKPYDRFVKEQIAGDLLPDATRESVTATGFLVAGPWDEVGNTLGSTLLRSRVRQDELEDVVSATCQTFLGLTVNCARCHDHKFDPIPQRDYYRIQAALVGVRHGDRSILPPVEERARQAALQAARERIAALERRMDALAQEGRRRVLVTRGASVPALPVVPAARWTFEDDGRDAVRQLDLTLLGGARISGGKLRLNGVDAQARSGSLPFTLREKTLEAWVVLGGLEQRGGSALTVEDADGRVFDGIVYGERQPRKWTAGSDSFVRTRDLDAPPESARPGEVVHLAITYAADGSIAVYRNGKPYGPAYVPAGAGATLPSYAAARSHVLFGLRHGAAAAGPASWLSGAIEEARLFDRALSPAEVEASFRAAPPTATDAEARAALSAVEIAEEAKLQNEILAARKEVGALSNPPMAYAASPETPPAVALLKRGDVTQPGDPVAPGALSCVRQLEGDFGLPAASTDAERRLKLAEWIASPKNPLTPRVMVNRVWQYHFGRGLAASPSDFGINGEPPTHPELLDWLAGGFAGRWAPGTLAQGETPNTQHLTPNPPQHPTPSAQRPWSLKTLHRLIVTSSTYRQSARLDPKAMAVDAEDRLLWRMAPARLDAEELRDAMLSVSGELNPARGGPGFRPFDVFVSNSTFYTYKDKEGPEFNRRSIFRTVVNSGGIPLLEAFDCPDPSVKTPRRGTTTTPLQALALLNGSFVLRQARKLAERLSLEAGSTPEKQVERAYRLLYARPPAPTELFRDARFISEHGLALYCRVLLNSSEFVYLR